MISSKLASLETRIARLESSLNSKTATGWGPNSGAPATVRDILSLMSKLRDQLSSFPKNVKIMSDVLATGTFSVDFSGDWDDSVGLYADPDNTLDIDFKLVIEGDGFATFNFSVNNNRVGKLQINVLNQKQIIKELYYLDPKLEKIYVNEFGGEDPYGF
jgi:hypothetical protein